MLLNLPPMGLIEDKSTLIRVLVPNGWQAPVWSIWSMTKFSDAYMHQCRDHFVYAPSQWEATLPCNVVSHWLGAYTKWSPPPALSGLFGGVAIRNTVGFHCWNVSFVYFHRYLFTTVNSFQNSFAAPKFYDWPFHVWANANSMLKSG